jgi:hypothetical protein
MAAEVEKWPGNQQPEANGIVASLAARQPADGLAAE